MGMTAPIAANLQAQQVARGATPAAPANDVLRRRVSIDLDRVSVKSAIDALVANANARVIYQEETLDAVRSVMVSLHAVQMPLGDALEHVLQGTQLSASMASANVVGIKGIAGTSAASSQGIVTGVVRGAKTKQPVRGATILVDEAKKGVMTGEDGRFRLTVSSGTHVVHVKMLGYGKVTKNVTVQEGEVTTIEVQLDPSVNTLEQVVVTGTVVPTELKAVPNAITVITAKELQDRGITRIDQLFHGDVPGLFTPRTGAAAVSLSPVSVIGGVSISAPGAASVSARGGTHLTSDFSESIKVYVDGVELANRYYLGLIDPSAIERIEIISGPEASTIYGSNAINGVMQIFTKRGTSSRPQVTAEARSAWTQNNLNSAVAPDHRANLSASGVNGGMSYNVGGSWGYTGSWAPGVREQTLSGNAGERMTAGRLTLDGNLQVTQDGNVFVAANDQRGMIEAALSGNGPQASGAGNVPETRRGMSTHRTVGGTGTYAVTSWWSHTVTLGLDQVTTFSTGPGKRYIDPTDTAANLGRNTNSGFTAAYNTTLQVPLASLARAVVTVGVDESHSANTLFDGGYAIVGGEYKSTSYNGWYYSQSQAHEHGGFLTSQLGIGDALFLTYGLRAVYNPNVGANQNPNLEPSYGVALSHEFGAITAKLRASYGTATRPPAVGAKDPVKENGYDCDNVTCLRLWGTDIRWLANPDLVPESQRGGEGGLELYVGNWGSLQVTHYNQTVDHLIVTPLVDSVDLLPALRAQYGIAPWAYPLRQLQNLNIGSVRNQGWEEVGTLNLWRFTATGTYSWTKSRLIGITPKYRGQFPYYVVGAPFQLLPEHTYALGLAYVHGGGRIQYNIQGEGSWQSPGDFFWARTGNQYSTRLQIYNSRSRRNFPDTFTEVRPGYLLGNLNVSQQLTSRVEALMQIDNLTNSYLSEVDPHTQQKGRTTGLGLRFHW